eukprot:gnl/TRDRNA2_/TRDRNA2_48217_c0_seq1.p1 gnl/TRDRNA2_/TRDRNA2_48217_c0~~gnl/TRDRNA2_/TRDRNA2_48217_c0_seq1.p1  ORF type:complete len:237 (+),score=25.37 gnl/TRDRNA2_/TRDRNA2_48217_c0_seq1:90-713(+)
MSLADNVLWNCYLCDAHSYLELGTGSSLLVALVHHTQLDLLHAIDCSRSLLDHWSADPDVAQGILKGQIVLKHFDYGQFEGQLIYGHDLRVLSAMQKDEQYAVQVGLQLQQHMAPPSGVLWWDVVFLDGPFRWQGALWSVLQGDGVILIHDIPDHLESGRDPPYEFFEVVDQLACADGLGAFRRKKHFNATFVRQALDRMMRSGYFW